MSPRRTTRAAYDLQKQARLIWVPVGGNAPKEQLEKWASSPADQNVVRVAEFEQMTQPSVITEIISDICPVAK